jgi:hypothetical protein
MINRQLPMRGLFENIVAVLIRGLNCVEYDVII